MVIIRGPAEGAGGEDRRAALQSEDLMESLLKAVRESIDLESEYTVIRMEEAVELCFILSDLSAFERKLITREARKREMVLPEKEAAEGPAGAEKI